MTEAVWCVCGCGVWGYPQPSTGHCLNCFCKPCGRKREARRLIEGAKR